MQFILFYPYLTGTTKLTDTTGQTGEKQEDVSGAKVITTLKGSMGERITKALHKVEEKKKKRAERRAQVQSNKFGTYLFRSKFTHFWKSSINKDSNHLK